MIILPTRQLMAVLFCAWLGLMGASQANSASPVLDKVIASGELKVGMSGEQPPFNTLNRTGQIIGLEVDLAKNLASAMGVKLKIVQKPFGELLQQLTQGEVDLVLSGMAITPERSQQVSFIGPYVLSGKSILGSAKFLAAANNGTALNQANVKLVALSNSTSQSFVERNLPNATFTAIESYDEGVRMLMGGLADAMVADMPICKLTLLRYPEAGFATLENPLTLEPVGIALAANDLQFYNLVNNYMQTFEKTGLLNKLRGKWFEDNSWIAALP